MGDVVDFPAWLRSRGGKIHPELDFFHKLPSGDRGVVARSNISEGELLLLLPIECAVYIPTEEELKKRPDAFPNAVRYLQAAQPNLSPFLATTLVLMSEMTHGSASPWAAYIATLPPSCPDCLLNWNDKEKQELQGTSLEQSGPDPAWDVYRRHVAPILASPTDLWPGLVPEQASAETGAGSGTEAAHADPCLAAFVRAAGLVQSRAFHLEAENWVSGAREISRLEGGDTQVFLLPGIDMINHSYSTARRNAHLERLNLGQLTAAKLLMLQGQEDATTEGGKEAAAVSGGGDGDMAAFFVMLADKPIKAGEEVLHTYGNLSDAQLLQTYGFLDSEDDFRSQTTATAAVVDVVLSPNKKRSGPSQAVGGDGADGGGGYRNPYNAALVPWTVVEEVCVGLLQSMDQAPSASLRRAKRDLLAATGVLQSAAPESTQFVLLAQEPLPDELTTAVQVLLMTDDEFLEVRREFGGPPNSAATATKEKKSAAGKGGTKKADGNEAAAAAVDQGSDAAAVAAAAAGGSGAGHPRLSLGTALLEEDEDFAEMVCITVLQVLETCMDRYPTSIKEDVRLLRSAECTGRRRLAVRARLGEKDVLQLAKKAVVGLMKRLRDGGVASASEASGSEEGEDEAEEESGDEEEEGRRRASKRQRRGLGAPPPEGTGGEADAGNGNSGGGDAEGEEAEGLLMGSDDSDKVGYGAVEYDDGIGEAHDRGKAHEAPQDQ